MRQGAGTAEPRHAAAQSRLETMRIRNPHYLFRDAIRLPLVDISRLADGELGLSSQLALTARATAAAGAGELALKRFTNGRGAKERWEF